MRFVIFVIDDTSHSATGDEMAAIDAYNDRLTANNHLFFAAGIADPSRATLFDNRLGAGSKRSGSQFDGPEHYSGFWIVDADSIMQAEAFARDGSAACNRKVELRPLLEASTRQPSRPRVREL
ncbi:MAG: YciI family protein [Candidatus Limnocylindrus sp.]